MRRQLRVEQVRHVQVDQLQARKRLQGQLQLGPAGREFLLRAGDPDVTLGGQLGRRRVAFADAGRADAEHTHARGFRAAYFFSSRAAATAK